MPEYTKLLKNKNFVLYSLGQAFSQFGDRLVQIILIGYVYKRWPGSSFQLAKVFFFTLAPVFIISPIAGVLIDRWNKKYVMVASDLFRGAAIFLIPALFIYRESAVPVYIILFFTFTAACFFLPTRLSVIPNLVEKEDLLLANSACAITWVISGIMGFSLGGILAESIGIQKSLYLNSAIYFLSAASFSFVFFSRSPKLSRRNSFFHELITGLKALLLKKKMRFVVGAFFIFSSMMGACYTVLIVFVQETLETMTKYIGALSVCIFVGCLVGSFVFGKVGKRIPRSKAVFLSLFLTGLSMNIFVVGLKLTGSVEIGGAFAFLVGFFLSPAYVTANTIVHETVDGNLRGRIFSSLGIVMNFGFLVFMFLASFLAEFTDRFLILVTCATGFVFFGLISFVFIPAGYLEDVTSS